MEDKENVEVLNLDEDITDTIESIGENAVENSVDSSDVIGTLQESASSTIPKYDSYFNRLIRYVLFLIFAILLFGLINLVQYSIKNNKSVYTENSSATYQVCLKDNDYYSKKCLGEDREYVSEITDKINVTFNYSLLYQTKQNKKYKYYIESKMKFETADDNKKELLTKSKKLTKEKTIDLTQNVLNLSDSVDVPFKEYDDYAKKYKNDYSLSSNAKLVVSLVLKDGKTTKEVSSIIISLTNLTYSVNKNVISNKKTEYVVNDNSFLAMLLSILMVISILIILLILLKLIKFLFETRNRKTPYEKKLDNILNTYDRVIVTLEDKNTIINDQDIYTVKSFLELLDVRDTIDKPILYYRVNDIKSEFYVQDINKTYKYTIKESDFENNK